MSEATKRLEAIVALIDLAVAGVGSRTEAAVLRDRMLVDASAYRVMHVGETVSGLPATVTDRHPQLPWRRMVGMRHRLAHDYDGLDAALIWRTVREHLGTLRLACLVELAIDNAQGE